MIRIAPIVAASLLLLAGVASATQAYDGLWIGHYKGQVQASIVKSGPDSFRVDLRLPQKPQCHVNVNAAPDPSGMTLYLIRHRQVACTINLSRNGDRLVASQDGKTCYRALPADCAFNGTATLSH